MNRLRQIEIGLATKAYSPTSSCAVLTTVFELACLLDLGVGCEISITFPVNHGLSC